MLLHVPHMVCLKDIPNQYHRVTTSPTGVTLSALLERGIQFNYEAFWVDVWSTMFFEIKTELHVWLISTTDSHNLRVSRPHFFLEVAMIRRSRRRHDHCLFRRACPFGEHAPIGNSPPLSMCSVKLTSFSKVGLNEDSAKGWPVSRTLEARHGLTGSWAFVDYWILLSTTKLRSSVI